MASNQAKAQLAVDIEGHLNVEELIDDSVTSVAENLKPEDVFDESQLEEWAQENGFEKKKEE